MTDGRWGGDRWGEGQWGSGESVAHSMSARAGIVAGAYADRIGPRHSLEASATVGTNAFGIGAGPAAIHPLRANAEISTGAAATALRALHQLAAVAIVRSSAAPAPLRMQHRMRATSDIEATASAWLSIRHPLEARARVRSSAEATALAIAHPLRALVVVASGGSAIYTIEVPQILEPTQVNPGDPAAVVPGAINLAENPIAALGLRGWSVYEYATVELDSTFWWDGLQSVLVQPGSVGSGVEIRTPRPLGLAIKEGAVMWGQAMVALNQPGPPPVALDEDLPPIPPEGELPEEPDPEPPPQGAMWVTGWIEVTYSDGSTEAGDPANPFPIVATGYYADWDIFLASFAPDPDKVVIQARLVIVRDQTPSTPLAFWVGGAQIEYDRWQLGPQPVRSDSALQQTQEAA